ncbi:MAG: hypothetical protein [Bacteriophage sp.]|jgi:hypothetical protein|nr:MAG: hypothetical protein [Bacteriophage sp.]UVX68589.1 MAG: hypothetical protein [Bacteriophage sp.]UVX88892.1 MAG: hypothetical protein [Bacteriophage sp.]DAP33884.1 MAG TPA: hypothetical protein [Caudoviricetes sp.]
MMSDYKVIKDCGLLKKGDRLFWDESLEAYTLDESKEGYERSIMINDKLAEDLCKEGFLTTVATDKTVIEDTVEFIDNLVGQYKDDLLEVQNKFEKGEVQPCVKVESETVLYNLIKLANSIKGKLENE